MKDKITRLTEWLYKYSPKELTDTTVRDFYKNTTTPWAIVGCYHILHPENKRNSTNAVLSCVNQFKSHITNKSLLEGLELGLIYCSPEGKQDDLDNAISLVQHARLCISYDIQKNLEKARFKGKGFTPDIHEENNRLNKQQHFDKILVSALELNWYASSIELLSRPFDKVVILHILKQKLPIEAWDSGLLDVNFRLNNFKNVTTK
jgi:hypothetical protein